MNTTNQFKYPIAKVADFQIDGGACAKIGTHQIAIFRFSDGKWYACENACPHTGDMVLSRGIIGDANGEPKVVCPIHKRSFSLVQGDCFSGEKLKVKLFEVQIENDIVHIVSDENLKETI